MALKVCQLCAVDFTLKHFLLPLIDGMLAEGWEVVTVCSGGKHIDSLRSQGYSIKTISISRSINPLPALISFIRLYLFFRSQAFDILHVHTPVAALIGRIAGKLAGIPLVVYTAHGFYFHDHMPSWKKVFFFKLEQIVGRFTDLLFCQSSEDAATAIKQRIVPAGCVLAIGNGVDTYRFDPSTVPSGQALRHSLHIPSSAFVVGLIGRQVREKGIGEFLEAMILLSPRHPHMWVLLVGDRLDSDHDPSVTHLFAKAQTILGHRLVVTGTREDIPEILASMDLFCLPSWREGMPRTIIEAMMMAKPVVATNIRGSREEVVHNVTGLLVPVHSPSGIAEAVERILLDPSWCRALGVAGRLRALQHYDERRVVSLQLARIHKYLRLTTPNEPERTLNC